MPDRIIYQDLENNISVNAFTDCYILDEYNYLYLVSIAGSDSSVKAISSAVIQGKDIEIIPSVKGSESINCKISYINNYKLLTSKLNNILLHQIVASESFFMNYNSASRLLFVSKNNNSNASNVEDKIYDIIKSSYSTPVISEWKTWLYNKLAENSCIEELNGNAKALKLNIDEDSLDNLISEGIKLNEISFYNASA